MSINTNLLTSFLPPLYTSHFCGLKGVSTSTAPPSGLLSPTVHAYLGGECPFFEQGHYPETGEKLATKCKLFNEVRLGINYNRFPKCLEKYSRFVGLKQPKSF